MSLIRRTPLLLVGNGAGHWTRGLTRAGKLLYHEAADLQISSSLLSIFKVSLHPLSWPWTCSVAPASLDFTILLLWSPDQLDLQDILLGLPDYMFLWRLGRESSLLVQALKLLVIPYIEEYWSFCQWILQSLWPATFHAHIQLDCISAMSSLCFAFHICWYVLVITTNWLNEFMEYAGKKHTHIYTHLCFTSSIHMSLGAEANSNPKIT